MTGLWQTGVSALRTSMHIHAWGDRALRRNLPVTQREYAFDGRVTLLSTTDPKGRITYANAAFVAVSGYEAEELIGQPHNLVRHPDMPPEAFADMWKTIQSGVSWTALVQVIRVNPCGCKAMDPCPCPAGFR